jgi:hypothetical protein
MGRNKKTRTKLAGLQRAVDLHKSKIEREKRRANPDLGLIRHWEKEVKACQEKGNRLRQRLPGKQK